MRKLVTMIAPIMVAAVGGCSSGFDDAEAVTEMPGPAGPPASPPSVTTPQFGPVVHQDDPPPPISGGTIAVAPDGTVIAADPDRDRVYIIDVAHEHVLTVALEPHDEPGRVAIDADGRVHVALRRAGDLVTIDPVTPAILARRHACSAPRGVAYDPNGDVVHVACVGGELVTFPAAGGEPTKVRQLVPDLRDVVVARGGLRVSTFRKGEILAMAEDGTTHEIHQEQRVYEGTQVAWRMIAVPPDPTSPDDDVLVAGQQAPDAVVATPAEYYVDACSPVGPAPIVRDGDTVTRVPEAVLPVDVAVSRTTFAIVSAANSHTPDAAQVLFGPRRYPACAGLVGTPVPGQITSVAFLDDTSVVALSREPAALFVIDSASVQVTKKIPLGYVSREDTGHAIFHANAGAGIACASCHVEGRDDGHAWFAADTGPRRTPSLAGTLRGTAPYHWTGEAKDMDAIAKLTFESRMKGPDLPPSHVGALAGWLEALEPVRLPQPTDADAVARGAAIFGAQCASCHKGGMLTNNETVDVGTGGAFQVPSLVAVAARAPYLHDGSAQTLERAIAAHANALDAEQSKDVVTYLGTR